MRRRVRWRDRRSGSFSGSASRLVRRSSASLRRRLGSVQATNSGSHAAGQGRQHRDDNGGTGFVYAGLAQLFRLLRNAGSADLPHSLGPVATQGGFVATVENTVPPAGRTAGTGGSPTAGQ